MNTLTQTLNLTNQNQIQQDQKIGQKQNKFLDTMLGKAINTGINLGIRALLPNFIEDQVRKVSTLNKNIERWNEYYNQHDFDGIRRETNNIQRNIKSLFPIETTIKEARKIENLYKIIERKGGDFNLSEEEINLANRLVY